MLTVALYRAASVALVFSLVIIAAQWSVVQRKEKAWSKMLIGFMIHVWHFRDVTLFFVGKYCYVVLVVHKHSGAVVMSSFIAVSVVILTSLQ